MRSQRAAMREGRFYIQAVVTRLLSKCATCVVLVVAVLWALVDFVGPVFVLVGYAFIDWAHYEETHGEGAL